MSKIFVVLNGLVGLIYLNISTLFASAEMHHAEVARVLNIKGSVFISVADKTHEAKKGEVLFANSLIFVEQKGQITLSDEYDNRYHLGSASSLFVGQKYFELQNGDLWIQGQKAGHEREVRSANAKVVFQNGEAILTYDPHKGRTQLAVLNGMMNFANLKTENLNLMVGGGNFSFVDYAYEAGMPRDPTPIGKKTFSNLTELFVGISPLTMPDETLQSSNRQDTVVKEALDKIHSHLANGHKSPEIHGEAKTKPPFKAGKASAKKQVRNVETYVNRGKTTIKIYGQTGYSASATTAIYDINLQKNSEDNKGKVAGGTSGSGKENTTESYNGRMPASMIVPDSGIEKVVPAYKFPAIEHDLLKSNEPKNKESEKLIEELRKL